MVSFPTMLMLAWMCQPDAAFDRPLYDEMALSELGNEGKEQYKLALERTSMPQSGSCWKEAVSALKDGCRQLDDKTHSELALRFSDCFLEMSGHEKHNCQFNDKSCLREMNQAVFDTYSKFYIHTQSMCYFLYNQVWHEETEKTIARLTTTSSKMSEQLQQSVETQSKMLSDLLMVGEVVGQVSSVVRSIEDLLFDGYSVFGTVLFFAAAAVAVAAVSRTRSAASVVPQMFAVLFAGAAVESILVNWLIDDAESRYCWVWRLRWFELLACVVLLSYAAWKYQRYGPINNVLLKNMNNKVDRLLDAIANESKVKREPESLCHKCKCGNTVTDGIPLHGKYYGSNNKQDLYSGMYETRRRETTSAGPSIYSQSVSGRTLPRHSLVADSPVKAHQDLTHLAGSHGHRYYRSSSLIPGNPEQRYAETSSIVRRSPTPGIDTQQPPPPSPPQSPPPPYSSVDLGNKTTEEYTAPLTRRDFYTPEREIYNGIEMKKAVVQIEPLKVIPVQAESQLQPQMSRRQTPTRRVQQIRSGSQQRTLNTSSEYNLHSHERHMGSSA